MKDNKRTLQFSQKSVSCVDKLFAPVGRDDVVQMLVDLVKITEENAIQIIDNLVSSGVLLENSVDMRSQTAVYSAGYSNPDNQRAMLLDWHRTDSYRRAIEEVVSPGDLVIDVGSGSGILSLFASSAGAKKVFSVEATPIIEIEKELIKINGLEDNIECLNVYAHNVSLDTKVDVIVSEWMGMFLMEEYMFDAVQVIRDNFLIDGGSIIPNAVKLYLAPIENRNLYYKVGPGFWKSTFFNYNFNIDIAKDDSEEKFIRCIIPPESFIAPEALLLDFDCMKDTTSSFHFTKSVEWIVQRDSFLHGFCGYFDAVLAQHVTLHTAPRFPATDWQQIYFPIEEILTKEGDFIQLTITTSQGSVCPRILLEGKIIHAGKILTHFKSKQFIGASKYAQRALEV